MEKRKCIFHLSELLKAMATALFLGSLFAFKLLPANNCLPIQNNENYLEKKNVLDSIPVAVNDSVSTITNFGPLIIDWDDNDILVDHTFLSSFDAISLNGGIVTNNDNGTFTYTTPIGYTGTDAFTYTICDNQTPLPNCSTAAIGISIVAQQQCITGLYQVISDTIKLLDVTSTPASYVVVASPSPAENFNATGYNYQDGLIYGYVMEDSTIYAYNITTDTFIPVYKHLEGNSNYTGDFDVDGNLYYTSAYRDIIYKLNVSTGVRTEITMPTFLGSNDVAFRPGVGGESDLLIGVTTGNQLVEYNIDNNTISKTNLTGPITSETGGYGAVWLVAGTNLYTFNNASGNIYYIDINTKQSVLQTSSEPNNSNDGMSCLFGIDPFDISNSLDYGDAPDSYGTLQANNGAAAIPNISFKLGNFNDVDTIALPTIDADGDDTDAEGNDDDGVNLNNLGLQNQELNIGETYTLSINAPIGFGYISGWIDWNGDGQFDHSEAIAIDSSAAQKIINISFEVPVNAAVGTTYARFRLAARVGGGPTGLYSFGEIEDYKIDITNNVELELGVLLQGAMLGGTDTLMRDDLRQQNYLPLTQPYNATFDTLRFAHVGGGGNETTNNTVLLTAANTPNAIVDWVFIELRDATDHTTIFRTISALVQRDGDIVAAATGGNLSLAGLPAAFYVSIKHRNHLGVMTANPIAVANARAKMDFRIETDADCYNFGIYEGLEMAEINGKKALWAGNTNKDTKAKYDGVLNDRIVIAGNILASPLNNLTILNYANVNGYFQGDVNMDGKVKYDGVTNDRIIMQSIILTYPLNYDVLQVNNFDIMLEQLP